MFDGEPQAVLQAVEIEEDVGPGEDVAAASKALPVLILVDLLAGVMDQCNSGLVAPLQGAEMAEDGGEFLGAVLVAGMESDQRVQQEQPRPVFGQGCIEPGELFERVEAELGHVDNQQFKCGKGDLVVLTESVQAFSDRVVVVFGQVDDDRPRPLDLKAAQARFAGRDAHGQLKSQPGLSRLRMCANDPDSLGGPEGIDQPAPLRWFSQEAVGPDYGQQFDVVT